jgi:hypothetical protein
MLSWKTHRLLVTSHPPLTLIKRQPFISHPTRRHLTTAPTPAALAAEQLLDKFSGRTSVTHQYLDANQLQKLALTLNRTHLHYHAHSITSRAPKPGTPLPPGYHLVYFTPGGLEAELGPDGTDRTFSPTAPFTRRMWAGGTIRWSKGVELRVGEEAEERTRLVSAVPKRARDGGEMVLVEVEKEVWGKRGLAVVDLRWVPFLLDSCWRDVRRHLGITADDLWMALRSWVFRPEVTTVSAAAAVLGEEGIIRGPSTVEDIAIDGAGEL